MHHVGTRGQINLRQSPIFSDNNNQMSGTSLQYFMCVDVHVTICRQLDCVHAPVFYRRQVILSQKLQTIDKKGKKFQTT